MKSLLQQYYYYIHLQSRYVSEINELDNEMANIKAISYGKIAGTSEESQHRLLRLMEKKDNKKRELRDVQLRCQTLGIEIDFTRLNEDEIKLLEYLYLDRLNYQETAQKMYLTNKAYVCRKHNAVLAKLAK